MTSRERFLRDIEDYWRDIREKPIPHSFYEGAPNPRSRDPHGRSGAPAFFRAALIRNRYLVPQISEFAWTCCRGHLDTYLSCLMAVAAQYQAGGGAMNMHFAKQIIWKIQKRCYRAWKSGLYLGEKDNALTDKSGKGTKC